MDDESDKISRLEDRIEQLEATTKKMMPTRRDALKFGGAAAIGAAAMSGTASAGSSQVGTIGNASNLVDVEAEDVNVSDTLTTQDIVVNGTAIGPFGGGGIVFEQGDSITEHRAHLLDVSANSFSVIFDVSPSVDIYGGALFSENINQIRVTFASGSPQTIGSGVPTSGTDRFGEEFSVFPIWPMKDVEKLEFKNTETFTVDFGYQVFTT